MWRMTNNFEAVAWLLLLFIVVGLVVMNHGH
jgi:hypothetical protein